MGKNPQSRVQNCLPPAMHRLPKHYRMRAMQVRGRAEDASNEQTRRSLLQIADLWERMARYEERANPHGHLRVVGSD